MIVLDMDSSESPTYGEQEGSAYNGHFGCTCYHPLFMFNQVKALSQIGAGSLTRWTKQFVIGSPVHQPSPQTFLTADPKQDQARETSIRADSLPRKREMVGTSTGDPRFFTRSGPHHLVTIVKEANGIAPELDLLLEGVAPLQTARPNEVSFMDNPRYASTLEQTLAGAVIVHPDMQARVPAATVPIVTSEPYEGWARVAALFHPMPPVSPGIHPAAIVAEGARVDPSTEVGPTLSGFSVSFDWLGVGTPGGRGSRRGDG
jgi:UDP-3-O-[3-hydroxymyristoyl] glucosamine N-acyltransferase, LpxD/Transposase DDE domain group 1